MKRESNRRVVARSSSEKEAIKATRAKFQDSKPTLDELASSGEFEPAISQLEYIELMALCAELKQERERQGLSLAELSDKVGIDRSAISRLENGQQGNPTFTTLARVATGLGKEIGFSLRPKSSSVRRS